VTCSLGTHVMRQGSSPRTEECHEASVYGRADHRDPVHTVAELGKPLKKSDLVGRTISIFGDVVEEFTAPEDAVFTRATTLSTVAEGERVAALGVVP